MTSLEKPLLVNPNGAFRFYFKIRGKRSLSRLLRELGQAYGGAIEKGEGRLPSLVTLETWSRKYNWQKKVEEWDAKKDEKLEEELIEEAAIDDKKILDICETGMKVFEQGLKGRLLKDRSGNQIYDKDGKPMFSTPYLSPFEFKALWEIYQVVRGKVTDRVAYTQDDKKILAAYEKASPNKKQKILKLLTQLDAIIDEDADRKESKRSIQE